MIYIEIVGGGLAFGTLFCVYKLYKIYTKPKSAWEMDFIEKEDFYDRIEWILDYNS